MKTQSSYRVMHKIYLIFALLFFNSCARDTDTNLNYEFTLPQDFTIEVAAGPDLVDYPMFVTVDETGRLFVFESTGDVYKETEDALANPQFRIKLLEDTDEDGTYDKAVVFADKIGFPQGGVFHEGSLYASSAPDLLRLTDTNGDGVADKREVLLSGWTLNVNANSLIGPFMAPDGWLYLTSAIEGFDVKTKEGQQLKGETARIWRVRPDGSGLEWISAGGMNNPVGLAFTSASEPLGTMTYFTEPSAGLRDALIYWTEGGVYPKPNANIQRDGLPLTGELMPVVSKYSRVAPAGLTRYQNNVLGEDYQNNLFSSQFNTHRILRHKLTRHGGSFRAEEEVFLSTDNEDFHPTDVHEDGDGSLLVVETGGWFLKGCPLSQVSKPELKGTIYRIRRKDSERVKDPFGKSIKWNSLSPDEMARYLEDARPFVRNVAVKNIAKHKSGARSLAAILKDGKSVESRILAAFALYRIGTADAMQVAREGLNDKDVDVRVAAARVAGLAKDKGAVAKLIDMIANDEPACKRQAATALGQIGDSQVVPQLLAAGNVSDRFVEHAIIYSLILLDDAAKTIAGLKDPSSKIKRIALIALDQMKAPQLTDAVVSPYLSSGDSIMQATSVWVASHHPEWAGSIARILAARLRKPMLIEKDKSELKKIMVSYCNSPEMQKLVADEMSKATTEKKMFLFDIMTDCQTEKFPERWVSQVGDELVNGKDLDTKFKALSLIRLHNIAGLTKSVEQAAASERNPPELRIRALGLLLNDSTAVNDKQFDYLYANLNARVAQPLRQQAATVLSQGKLTESQINRLATDFLPSADAFILPRAVPIFKRVNDPNAGKALIDALMKSESLDNFTEASLRRSLESLPNELDGSVDQLVEKLKTVHADRLKKIDAVEKSIGNGDLDRGRAIFFGKAICSTCHTIGREGGSLGPDLTSIQRDRSVHDLIEAVVYPSASLVREYETYEIKTNGKTYKGVIKEQNSSTVVLGISQTETVRIPTKDIVSTEILEVSMMPEGLDGLLTEQELADLMAFLLAQDQDPDTDEKLLR